MGRNGKSGYTGEGSTFLFGRIRNTLLWLEDSVFLGLPSTHVMHVRVIPCPRLVEHTHLFPLGSCQIRKEAKFGGSHTWPHRGVRRSRVTFHI